MTEFGMVTQVGRNVFLGGYPRPHPKRRGLNVRKIIGTSYMRMRTHSMRSNNQFCMVIKLDVRKN